jgi:hypothetical protein
VTGSWLGSAQGDRSYDVLHLHSVDAYERRELREMLERCTEQGRPIVCTVHELEPARDRAGFREKLALLCAADASFVFLSEGARARARERWDGFPASSHVIPHGYALPPGHQAWGRRAGRQAAPAFGVCGRWRPHIAIKVAALNWLYGVSPVVTSSFRAMLPGVADRELADGGGELGEFLTLACVSRAAGLHVALVPEITDAEIVGFVSRSDVLVLPYRSGTYWAQLDLAFDLGVIPVTTNVGYAEEQWRNVAALVPPPIVADWTDGNEEKYGQRLLWAMLESTGADPAARSDRGPLREFRLSEHQDILAAYADVYAAN